MIPVSTPLLNGNEKRYLCQAIDEGEISGGGSFVRRFEDAFARWSGKKYAVAVCNGTAALETAIWATKIEHINIPSGTIISCYLAARRAGVRVGLRDNRVEESFHSVAMKVHLFGELDETLATFAIDDCSQHWDKCPAKDVACYSLYANKLITSGEGGVIVTDSEPIARRASGYRNLCHSKERFVHTALGYNFRMSNLQAAVALAQLERIDEHVEIKQRNRELYKKYLPENVKIMFDNPVPWMYLIATQRDAGEMVQQLRLRGIECRRFFYPLHRQPCLQRALPPGAFPVANNLWEHAFYLPSGFHLTERDIQRVCLALRDTQKSTTS